MGTYYWHDQATKTVYWLTAWPAEKPRSKHKPPRYTGCTVAGDSHWVSANWKEDPHRGWLHEGGGSPYQSFDERDPLERAERIFVAHHTPPRAVKITADEYKSLEAQYRADAQKSKP